MEYVGELLDFEEFVRRTRQYSKAGTQHHYFMALNADEVVDATLKGSISRFINHSCDPNCETQKVGFRKRSVCGGRPSLSLYSFFQTFFGSGRGELAKGSEGIGDVETGSRGGWRLEGKEARDDVKQALALTDIPPQYVPSCRHLFDHFW